MDDQYNPILVESDIDKYLPTIDNQCNQILDESYIQK